MACLKYGCGMHHGDELLRKIQRAYVKLSLLPHTTGRKRETPEYRALVEEIRALVDEWKQFQERNE